MIYEPLIIDIGVGTNKRYRLRPFSLFLLYLRKSLFLFYSAFIVTSFKLLALAVKAFINRIISMVMLFIFFIIIHLLLDYFGYKYTIGTLIDGLISIFTAVKHSEELEHRVNSTLRLYLRKLYNNSDWFRNGEYMTVQ